MNRGAGLEWVRGPVGPQRVRVREAFRDAGGEAVTADEPVDRLSGQRLRFFAAVTAEPHEQRMLVAQASRLRERCALAHASGGDTRTPEILGA